MSYGWSVTNRADLAGTTLTCASAMHADFPLTNLQVRQLSRRARTSGTSTSIAIELENAAGLGLNPIIAVLGLDPTPDRYYFSIYGSNVSMGASDCFALSDTLVRPSVTNDPTRDVFPLGLFAYVASISPRYVYIEIDADYAITWDIGRVWCGPTVPGNTELNFSVVSGMPTHGATGPSRGGQGYGVRGAPLRELSVTMESLTEAAKQHHLRALAYAGAGREMIFMRRADATTDYRRDNSLYCNMPQPPSFTPIGNDLEDLTMGLKEER